MKRLARFIKGLIISLVFNFIEKKKEYDVGRIRACVKFTNGIRCETTIIGKVELAREAISGGDVYPLEYSVTSATDLLHTFLQDIEDGLVDFIVTDTNMYYRLAENTIDNIQVMEQATHIVTRTVYDKVRK